MDLIEFQ